MGHPTFLVADEPHELRRQASRRSSLSDALTNETSHDLAKHDHPHNTSIAENMAEVLV